ncbi:MAG: glutaminyl-peptide cyclotransferase [Bryobacteraceae bacterium]
MFPRPVLLAVFAALLSCGPSVQSAPPVLGYRVVHVYPHDRAAFTQGLFFLDGYLWEGTGLNGQSSLRKIRLDTGEVVKQHDIPSEYFGEGIAPWKDRLIQLTWQSGTGFVYHRESMQLTRSFRYAGEGWGLTTDGHSLIMSDGSAVLRFLDPETLAETRRLTVVDDAGLPVRYLNELEFVKGEIWANIWQTDRVARIRHTDGRIASWVDLTGLLSPQDRSIPVDVLNGIAHDPATGRLFVTGKNWPKLFEIEINEKPTN